MTGEEAAKEYLRQADLIIARRDWWSLRMRFNTNHSEERIAEEARMCREELFDMFRQLKDFYCEYREEIHSVKRTKQLQQAIDGMEACILEDLEREFGLVTSADDG